MHILPLGIMQLIMDVCDAYVTLYFQTVSCIPSRVHEFLARYPTFRARSDTQKLGAQNQSARPIETHLKTLLFVFYYLNSTYGFLF